MECCKKELVFKKVGGIEYTISAVCCPECKTEYHQKQGADVAYKAMGEGFVCTGCGGEIMTATVAHTVRDDFFPLSGSGRVQNEAVPYCKNCEKEPAFHGKAV